MSEAVMSMASVPTVDLDEARRLVDDGAEIMDVRDQHEWDAGHCRHSVHVPMSEVSDSARFTTRTRTVICVSRTGRRASEAVRHLRTAGVDAVVLHGGLRAWIDAGCVLVTDDDSDGRLV
jgi:rhodanese-related sulfurtransferase